VLAGLIGFLDRTLDLLIDDFETSAEYQMFTRMAVAAGRALHAAYPMDASCASDIANRLARTVNARNENGEIDCSPARAAKPARARFGAWRRRSARKACSMRSCER
jgi:hypothetical protein